MDTKHTPGPWRRSGGNIGNLVEGPSGKRLFEGDDGYRGVATVQPCIDSDKFNEQDANLEANIAVVIAAPDMLQALIAVRDAFTSPTRWGDMADAMDPVLTVIAKATNTPSPRPEVLPVTSGDDAVPASDQNAASPGDAGGADLCPGCGIPIHDVKSCDAVHCGVWGEE
jgi:hypothetical protein